VGRSKGGGKLVAIQGATRKEKKGKRGNRNAGGVTSRGYLGPEKKTPSKLRAEVSNENGRNRRERGKGTERKEISIGELPDGQKRVKNRW